MNKKRYGRWASGDIAEGKHSGILYRVIGFITSPAVIFSEIGGDTQLVEVAGCVNEVNDLIHYQKSPIVLPNEEE